MIGGDLKVADYRFRAHNKKSEFVLFPHDPKSKEISMFGAILLLVKVGIATDPFFMYEQLFECGIIEALLIFIFVMLIIQVSTFLYIRCWFYGIAYNYPEIWVCVFGSKVFRFIPIVLNILAYVTFIIWHGFEIYNDFVHFLSNVWPNCPGFIVNKWFLTYFMCFVTAVPPLFAKSFGSLRWVAILGNVAMIVAILCCLAQLIHSIHELGFSITVNVANTNLDDDGFSTSASLFSKDSAAFFNTVGAIMTAFFTQPMLNLVFSNMKNPTIGRCLNVTWAANIYSLVVHFVSGLLIYFLIQCHYSAIENYDGSVFNLFVDSDFDNENILFNFPKKYIEAIIFQIASYICSITSNATYTYFLAHQVSFLISDKEQIDSTPIFISGVVIILFNIGMNFIGGEATSYIEFIATVSFSLLVFVLPGFFYLKLYRFTKPGLALLAIGFMVIGIPVVVLVMYYQALELGSE